MQAFHWCALGLRLIIIISVYDTLQACTCIDSWEVQIEGCISHAIQTLSSAPFCVVLLVAAVLLKGDA